MRRKKKKNKTSPLGILIILIIAGLLLGIGPKNNPSQNAENLSSACANPEPLKHVYNPRRLVVLDPCKTVSGTVVKAIKEKDGDTHIRLKVDPQFSDTINQANIDKQEGNLVVEIVCAYEITQADAVDACSGYENKIPVPETNDHVVITGQFVSDTGHGGWNEIHPVYGISVK